MVRVNAREKLPASVEKACLERRDFSQSTQGDLAIENEQAV